MHRKKNWLVISAMIAVLSFPIAINAQQSGGSGTGSAGGGMSTGANTGGRAGDTAGGRFGMDNTGINNRGLNNNTNLNNPGFGTTGSGAGSFQDTFTNRFGTDRYGTRAGSLSNRGMGTNADTFDSTRFGARSSNYWQNRFDERYNDTTMDPAAGRFGRRLGNTTNRRFNNDIRNFDFDRAEVFGSPDRVPGDRSTDFHLYDRDINPYDNYDSTTNDRSVNRFFDSRANRAFNNDRFNRFDSNRNDPRFNNNRRDMNDTRFDNRIGGEVDNSYYDTRRNQRSMGENRSFRANRGGTLNRSPYFRNNQQFDSQNNTNINAQNLRNRMNADRFDNTRNPNRNLNRAAIPNRNTDWNNNWNSSNNWDDDPDDDTIYYYQDDQSNPETRNRTLDNNLRSSGTNRNQNNRDTIRSNTGVGGSSGGSSSGSNR